MGIEDDLRNAFKYTNFSGNVDPLRMMRSMLETMELAMLSRTRAQIDARIKQLNPQSGSKQSARDSSCDPFVILGVNMDSTKEEVEKAFKEKAFKHHPDHGGTHEDMVRVNAARDAIYMFKNWSK
jgi:hypothetical protein